MDMDLTTVVIAMIVIGIVTVLVFSAGMGLIYYFAKKRILRDRW